MSDLDEIMRKWRATQETRMDLRTLRHREGNGFVAKTVRKKELRDLNKAYREEKKALLEAEAFARAEKVVKEKVANGELLKVLKRDILFYQKKFIREMKHENWGE